MRPGQPRWLVLGTLLGLALTACAKPAEQDAADPDAKVCQADCECYGKCLDGRCDDFSFLPRTGFCNVPSEPPPGCYCTGGTCDQISGCCRLPDGTIDPGDGPACTTAPPADAGG